MNDEASSAELPVICVAENGLDAAPLRTETVQWARANGFDGKAGKLLAFPDGEGGLGGHLFGMGSAADRDPLLLGLASAGLAPGRYRLEGDAGDPTLAELALRLGAYRFDRYRKAEAGARFAPVAGADSTEAARLAEAACLARDLVNTPANDLGPDAFEAYVRDFAGERGMQVSSIVGEALLEANLPMIHAVGRASAEAPRLLDLTWGDANAPKVTLVGKGVTFDTGGLDIKPPSSMALMKKDMGGAANILGLAHAIVSARLNVRLRVLLPIVENAISGAAFRPGDVLRSRAGLTVEIGNTDAEGRLILADALTLADEENPDLLVDMATLTGAARIALGPELPPLYATSDLLATELVEAGTKWGDPLWHMPLHKPYDSHLKSKIADLNHIAPHSFAGSVIAALFLKRFVHNAADWVHLDIFAWAPEMRPGRPFGGTDQGMRAVYQVLRKRFPG